MADYKELKYVVVYENDKRSLQDVKREADTVSSPRDRKLSDKFKKEESALERLRKQLKQYQKDLSDVQEQARNTGRATDANVAKQRALGTAITDTKIQIEQAVRGNLDYDSSLRNNATSLDGMKVQMRALKLQINQLDDPLGKNAQRLEELTKKHLELNNAVKKVEMSMGVGGRNVGFYEQSIRSAANAVAVFQGPLGPIAGRLNSFATTLSRVTGMMKGTTVASLTLGTALKGFLVASGIGAIAVILTSIIMYLQRTEDGMDRLRVTGARLSAFFGTFLDMLIPLGERIVNVINKPVESLQKLGMELLKVSAVFHRAFTDPMFAIEALSNFIKEQFVGRLIATRDVIYAYGNLLKSVFTLDWGGVTQAMDDFGDALLRQVVGTRSAADAIKNMFESMAENARKAYDEANRRGEEATRIQERLNELIREERDLAVERARQDRDMARSREMSRNMDIDAVERRKALQTVMEGEMSMIEQELAMERERLQLIEEKARLATDEEKDNQAIADQKAKVFKLEEEHAKRMMSFQRDMASVDRQIAERRVREERFRFDLEERNRQLTLNKVVQEAQRRGEILRAEEKRQADYRENLRERSEARLNVLIAEYRNQRFSQEEAEKMAQQQLDMELAEQAFQNEQRLREARLAQQRADFNQERTLFEYQQNLRSMALEREIDDLERVGMLKEAELLRQAMRAETIEEEGRIRVNQLYLQYLDEFHDEEKAMMMAQEQWKKELRNQELIDIQRLKDLEVELFYRNLNLVQKALSATSEAIFGENKVTALANTAINTYEAVSKASTAYAYPWNKWAMAGALAQGIAQSRKILATKRGGSNTPSGDSGGVSTNFGLVDAGENEGALMTATMFGNNQDMQPTIILEGELDSELLAIKVRTGNDAISGRSVGVGI